MGPLVPGNAACAEGAAATAAKPAMVPVARSVPKRPRHLLLIRDTLLSLSRYFLLQKRFSMSTEPLVTVAVAVVGPDFEPKWQTRVLVSGPVDVLVTVPHGTVIE